MRSNLFAAACAGGLLALPVAGPSTAPAAERFIAFGALSQDGGAATFTSDDPTVTALPGGPAGALRISGADLKPDGRLLVMDGAGVFYDVDPQTGAGGALFDGRRVVTRPVQINEPTTMTVTPDGNALIAELRYAERVDLATGTATAIAKPAALPTLDALPDGRLAGADWQGKSMILQASGGGAFTALAPTPVPWRAATKLTLDPSGRIGWIALRADRTATAVYPFNPATGQVGEPMTVAGHIDAFAALGPVPGTDVPAPPGGAGGGTGGGGTGGGGTGGPGGAGTGGNTGTAPAPGNGLRANVTFGTIPQSARSVVARRAVRLRLSADARATAAVALKLGKAKVGGRTLKLVAYGTDAVRIPLTASGARRLRRSHATKLTVTVTLTDAGGTERRTRTMRLGRR